LHNHSNKHGLIVYGNQIMKRIFLVICFFIGFFCGHAQNDTTKKQVNLNEVIISGDGKDNASDAFNFYRSSKISSTEDILSRNEGLNLIRRGAFGMEPTMRTYSAGQINITLNGMKMYGACSDKMDPVTVYIEPGNLSKLDINQGAGGSAMGSTIGGGLNMQMKEASFLCHKVIQLNAFTQFNSINNGFYNGLVLNTNNSKSSIRFNMVHRIADNYHSGGGVLVNHSGYEKWNFNTSIAHKLTSSQTLLVDYIGDFGRNMGYPALTMDVKNAYANIVSLTHRYTPLNKAVQKWETKVYFNHIKHVMDDSKRPEAIIHMTMPGLSYTTGFYTQLELAKKAHQLSLRLDGHQAFTRSEMTMYPLVGKPMYMETLPGNNLSNIGFSAVYNYYLKKALVVGASTRVDYYSQQVKDTFGILQWEAFGVDAKKIRTNFLKNISVFVDKGIGKQHHKITISYGERLPTSNERLGLYLYNRMDGYDYLGVYDIKPERAIQSEYKWSLQNKKSAFSMGVYYHHIMDYIYSYIIPGYFPMTIGGRGVKTYQNISYANLTGAEATYSFKPLEGFTFAGNARYTYATLSNGKNMQQVPPLKFVNTLRYQKGSLQLQAEHIGAFNQDKINVDYGEHTTSGWNVMNLRAAYMQKIHKQSLQYNISIENIFDKVYREHMDWGNVFRQGRNFVVGLNLYIN